MKLITKWLIFLLGQGWHDDRPFPEEKRWRQCAQCRVEFHPAHLTKHNGLDYCAGCLWGRSHVPPSPPKGERAGVRGLES